MEPSNAWKMEGIKADEACINAWLLSCSSGLGQALIVRITQIVQRRSKKWKLKYSGLLATFCYDVSKSLFKSSIIRNDESLLKTEPGYHLLADNRNDCTATSPRSEKCLSDLTSLFNLMLSLWETHIMFHAYKQIYHDCIIWNITRVTNTEIS
jgi:hypothetical protein